MAGWYLLDANIVSYIIKGKFPAVDRHLSKTPTARVSISSVTEAELRYGLARLPDAFRLQNLVEEFLLTVTILPWDSEAAKYYGLLRTELERGGRLMANLDMMIGAQALAAKATLMTNDRAFSRIKNLKVVDWTKA